MYAHLCGWDWRGSCLIGSSLEHRYPRFRLSDLERDHIILILEAIDQIPDSCISRCH